MPKVGVSKGGSRLPGLDALPFARNNEEAAPKLTTESCQVRNFCNASENALCLEPSNCWIRAWSNERAGSGALK